MGDKTYTAIYVRQDEKTIVKLFSNVFAQSAIDNDIDLDSFVESLNNFSDNATSAVGMIYKWRDEAVSYYIDAMAAQNKIRFTPATTRSNDKLKNKKKK